jgi:hypothetical protein
MFWDCDDRTSESYILEDRIPHSEFAVADLTLRWCGCFVHYDKILQIQAVQAMRIVIGCSI